MNNNLISTKTIVAFHNNSKIYNCDAMFFVVKEESLQENETKIPWVKEFLNINFKNISNSDIFFFKKASENNKPIFVAKLKSENLVDCRKLGAKIASTAKAEKFTSIKIKNLTNASDLEIVRGVVDKGYSFSKYLTEKKDEIVSLQEIYIESEQQNLQEAFDALNKETQVSFIIKDLVNEPANVVFPGSFEALIKDLFKNSSNTKVQIYNQSELITMEANLLLAVGAGHDNPEKAPRMITIEYLGKKESKEIDIALVGKGVTFDSGGYSIKPAGSMEGMKGDMAGAANVIGLMKYISDCNLKVNVVGTIALTENMINGNATKPGDIVKGLNGLTVEILNTDAEGRLILADALHHTATKYKPRYLLDFATLTGAIFVALGSERAGLFSNSDDFANKMAICAQETNEKLWRMPIGEDYTDLMKSKIADLRNISTSSGEGSSCTAAAFLEKFIANHKNWIHLDIAGVSDYDKEHKLHGHGASAWGFRLINQFIANNILK